MAIRTSIFDRYSEQRLAREAREREQAAQAAAEAAALALQVPVTPLMDTPSTFNFSGFHFAFPGDYRFRELELALDHQGETVRLNVQRRQVAEAQELAQLFAQAVDALRRDHPQFRLIRQRDALIAGSAALAVDYQFAADHDQRQGRLIAALVPLANGEAHQWLSIRCVIDPNISALSGWLIEFDQMLDGLARV
jgi:hypothetical protein